MVAPPPRPIDQLPGPAAGLGDMAHSPVVPGGPAGSPCAGLLALRQQGPAWWRTWNHPALRQACEASEAADSATADAPLNQAERWRWRALSAFMAEQAEALQQLDKAHQCCTAPGGQWADAPPPAGQSPAPPQHGPGPALRDMAAATVRQALVLALLDAGAMAQVQAWLARWDSLPRPAPSPSSPHQHEVWHDLAPLAAVALGGSAQGEAGQAAQAVLAGITRNDGRWTPDERLIAAQVLLEFQFSQQRFEAFDFLANAVEQPALFQAASPLMRARWLFTYGYTQHHMARADAAERAWRRAQAEAEAGGLQELALKCRLALARGLLNRLEVEAAQALIAPIQPHWGAGRTAQLVELQQLRARVHLLQGRASTALTLLQDALRTAEAAGLTRSESSACWSDLIQTLVALDRGAEAEAVLADQARAQQGRDAQISHCQALMLQALRRADAEPEAGRDLLAAGLLQAEACRYTAFLRLLPQQAAKLCALALRWQLSVPFVTELVRARALPAPAHSGQEWPWPVWLQLLGGFALHLQGLPQRSGGKTPLKPLELLRLLACQPGLAMAQARVQDRLWPDADAPAARKSFDVTVHRLRPLLGDPSLLWVADGQVGLDSRRVNSDVALHRQLVAQLDALALATPAGPLPGGSASPQVATCLGLVERLVALGPGELLPGVGAGPWLAEARRQHQADTVRAALAAATVLQHTQGGPAEAALLEAALATEPLAETLVARLMAAHARSGRQGDALRVYEAHCQHLATLGAPPSARLRAEWAALQPARGWPGS